MHPKRAGSSSCAPSDSVPRLKTRQVAQLPTLRNKECAACVDGAAAWLKVTMDQTPDAKWASKFPPSSQEWGECSAWVAAAPTCAALPKPGLGSACLLAPDAPTARSYALGEALDLDPQHPAAQIPAQR